MTAACELEKQRVMEELIVIITADHGKKNMGELGFYGEHGTADQGTCRIPMIIRWPGMKQGHVDTGLHYHLDLLPTIADLLGKKPMPFWDGAGYAPAITVRTRLSGRLPMRACLPAQRALWRLFVYADLSRRVSFI